MILNAAWLKTDNLAINRFPSGNEEETIGKGKRLSLQSCLKKGEAACSTRVRWHRQHCPAGVGWGGGEGANPS